MVIKDTLLKIVETIDDLTKNEIVNMLRQIILSKDNEPELHIFTNSTIKNACCLPVCISNCDADVQTDVAIDIGAL